MIDFLDRLTGRLVCRFIGWHEADHTWTHMIGRPICSRCKREL